MDANRDSERRLADITLDPRSRALWEISHWQNLNSASRALGHSLSIFQCSSIHSQGSVADIVLLQLQKSICLFISHSSQLYNFWQCPAHWQRDAKMNEIWYMLSEIDLKLLKYNTRQSEMHSSGLPREKPQRTECKGPELVCYMALGSMTPMKITVNYGLLGGGNGFNNRIQSILKNLWEGPAWRLHR